MFENITPEQMDQLVKELVLEDNESTESITIPSVDFTYPATQIIRGLWLGNYENASSLISANPLGIAAVLNVSTEVPYLKHANISYGDVPFEDGHAITEEQLKTAMDFALQHYNAGTPLLIHCAAGMSRSAAVTAALLARANVMDFNAALVFIKRRRPIVRPHHVILRSMRQLLKVWPNDGSLGKSF